MCNAYLELLCSYKENNPRSAAYYIDWVSLCLYDNREPRAPIAADQLLLKYSLLVVIT